MQHKSKPRYRRVPDPFDESADVRLARMGVLTADGEIDPKIMPVFAGIFCGLFYDDFADYFADDLADNLERVHSILADLHGRRDYKNMFLFLCVHYDSIRKSLPDPVWWLAGNPEAVQAFFDCFMEKLAGFVNQTVAELAENLEVSS
jgi:hypothetical protein